MSRYRPPPASKSKYLTAEGEQKLKAELHQLWKVERPQVTQSVAEAAALGDRSENAEYIYGKKRLREIDSRVRYLSKRLEEISVVSTPLTISTKSILAPGLLWKMTAANSFAIALLARMKSILNAATSALIPPGESPLGKPSESDITITAPTGEAGYFIKSISYSDKPT